MLRRILTLLRQDLTNAARDNILLYMMVGPLVLVVGTRLFLPSLDRSTMTFAVQEGVPAEVVARLEAHGTVERLSSAQAVRARVARNDDVPGLVLAAGENGEGEETPPLQLVLEGDEAEGPEALQRLVAQIIAGGRVAEHVVTARSGTRSLVTEYAAIIWIMIEALLASVVMAFNIVEDKETRAVQALGVSPLSLAEMTAARGLFAALLGLALVVPSTFILLGPAVNYGRLVAGYAMCVGLAILSGYVIGGLADSQLKAIGVLKFYMAIYLTLPIVTIVAPPSWHVLWYPLPNYWMWVVFERLFIGQVGRVGFWGAGLICLASSAAAAAALSPWLRRQLRFR